MAEAEAFALFYMPCHPNASAQIQEPDLEQTMAAGPNLQMACPSGAVIYIYIYKLYVRSISQGFGRHTR
jgi:hypothetical protein